VRPLRLLAVFTLVVLLVVSALNGGRTLHAAYVAHREFECAQEEFRVGNARAAVERCDVAVEFARRLDDKTVLRSALSLRGTARTALGDPTSALVDLNEASQLGVLSTREALTVARALVQLMRWEDADGTLSEAISRDGASADAYALRSAARRLLERNEDALADAERALALKPSMHRALYNKGAALMALGLLERALQSFDEVIALDPARPNAVARFGRATVLHRLGQHSRALEELEQLSQEEPLEPAYRLRRAEVLAALGDTIQCTAALERVHTLDPRYWEHPGVREWVLEMLERLRQHESSDVSGPLDGAVVKSLVRRAEWRLQLRDTEGALSDYQRALSAEVAQEDRTVLAARMAEIERSSRAGE
jgi:tetratricopeptide (TPR) repeat protein